MWLEALGPVAKMTRRVCLLHFGESALRHDADTRRAMKRIRLWPDAVLQPSASPAEVERGVTNPVTPIRHVGHEEITGADDDQQLFGHMGPDFSCSMWLELQRF
ncbi:hypothetical protein HPB50_024246 [Hyalomma asiaticum]|uniref:Uncharacterized protein n=1 Tax=Hyalomma asiaticum TaxID=266040 RepID=A0ACB7TN38_HYAAI|nr:hypothetical protein HPB50_024246 [Hyalomma asiaticum]